MKELGLFGLAAVLFVILLVGPFLRSFTEGFATQGAKPPVAAVAVQESIQEKTKNLMMDLERLNKLLENPTIDPSTKEKIVKEKANVQEEISKLTGATLPPAEIKKEGFEGILSSDLEKNGKVSDFLQKASESSPL